jgi:hypothetical protein
VYIYGCMYVCMYIYIDLHTHIQSLYVRIDNYDCFLIIVV